MPHSLGRSEERCLDDGARITAPEVHSYLSRVMYGRRNKMNPLWNSVLVGGVDKAGVRRAEREGGVGGQSGAAASHTAAPLSLRLHTRPTRPPYPGCSYVGYVDLYGTAFADDFAATGFGTHVALPIIRERWRAGLSEGEARAVLEDCVRVLWYRDTRALNKITLAKVGRERRGEEEEEEEEGAHVCTVSSTSRPDHGGGSSGLGALLALRQVGLRVVCQPQGGHGHGRLVVGGGHATRNPGTGVLRQTRIASTFGLYHNFHS